MKTYRVVILPSAQRDLDEAFVWIAERNESAAIRWFNGIIEVVDTLKRFPERCPLALENDFFEQEIRQILYGKRQHKYRILFTMGGANVFVLHVRHGARSALGQDEGAEA